MSDESLSHSIAGVLQKISTKAQEGKNITKNYNFRLKVFAKQRFQFRDIEGQIIVMIFKIDLNHASALLLFFHCYHSSLVFYFHTRNMRRHIKIQMLLFPRNGWMSLVYKIGKWTNFKFDIAFFRGLTITITISLSNTLMRDFLKTNCNLRTKSAIL